MRYFIVLCFILVHDIELYGKGRGELLPARKQGWLFITMYIYIYSLVLRFRV